MSGFRNAMHAAQPTRRDFFSLASRGIGAVALAGLLHDEGLLASEGQPTGRPGPPAKVRRIVQICLIGGLSQVDSFDYKPELAARHGQSLADDANAETFFGKVGLLRRPDFAFHQRGESGLWISDLFPHLAEQADRLTVVRSMTSESANHTPALYLENSGFQSSGFPSAGSWVSYGLGRLTDDLPAYVVLPDGRGHPNGGASIWSSGFLPADHQGVVLRSEGAPIRDLHPARPIDPAAERDTLALVRQLAAGHAERLGGDELVSARLRSYELAAKLQLAAPAAADLNDETAATHTAYGLDQPTTADMGRRCLLARRLLERGVRFVQLFSGGPIAGNPRTSWDAHENVHENHTAEAARIDRPIAALLADLAQRGLLADTLVMFTTEFGRTPFTQADAGVVGAGRDHNRLGFSLWLAGAGLRPGFAYGATDDIGWRAADNVASWYDLYATVLWLAGLDHEQLTFYHNGIQRRLTNVHGHVLRPLLA